MSTFILLDGFNLFFRARHAVTGSIDLKIGLSLHTMFSSIKNVYQRFNGDHLVLVLDGQSWRKDYYEPYKKNRLVARSKQTASELEEEQLFLEGFNDFTKFIQEKTNCTVLHNPRLEADDLIAGWIQCHPCDNHIIISSDSDFYQLINNNVSQYNGITDTLITHTGFYNSNGTRVKDKKTGLDKSPVDPAWIVFEKSIRGDSSDNIFSAYPGARTRGTKNRIGLLEAFQDRHDKGYNYNNFFHQRWLDHNGEEHQVLNDYNRNRILIDLTAQPEDIRQLINETIHAAAIPKQQTQVGIRLLKFCHKYDLQRISDSIQQFGQIFQAKYSGELTSTTQIITT